jgi:hypothetical protein
MVLERHSVKGDVLFGAVYLRRTKSTSMDRERII